MTGLIASSADPLYRFTTCATAITTSVSEPSRLKGSETPPDVAQHRVRPVSERVGRGRRERQHAARQIAHADLVAGLDPDRIREVKPRAAKKRRKVAMSSLAAA